MENPHSLNTSENWGPGQDFVFKEFEFMPFAPFNRMEKIRQYQQSGQQQQQVIQAPKIQRPIQQQQQQQQSQQQYNTQQLAPAVDEDDEFMTVEKKSKTQRAGAATKKKFVTKQAVAQQQTQVQQKYGGKNQVPQKTKNKRIPYQRVMYTRTKFKDNVQLKPHWIFLNEIQKTHIDKIKISNNFEVEDLCQTGSYREYDKSFDKITVRQERPLQSKDTFIMSQGTTEDPIILEYLEQAADMEEGSIPQVFTTDILLNALMTIKYSNFPWEMEVTKVKNVIILDKINQQTSYFDLYTANENTSGNLPEEEKEMLKLCLEATNINRNFLTQSCTGEEVNIGEEDEDGEQDEIRKIGYKYRKWTIDDNNIAVTVRCEVDSYMDTQSGKKECLMRAFNEYDLNSQWRKLLETNKGAVLTTEMRNNTCKVSKWICQGILSNVDIIKVAFVSRQLNKDQNKHAILQVDTFNSKELQQMINFKMSECWAIVKHLVEQIMEHDDGKYALVKIPYKPHIKIYQIPQEKEDEEQL